MPQGDAAGISHRNALAPPGGLSSFSLGWGADSGVNHHRHYHRQPALRDGAERGVAPYDPSGFGRAFAPEPMKSIPLALDHGGWGGGTAAATGDAVVAV